MYEIEDYVTTDGRNLFRQWFTKLKDVKVRRVVEGRLTRVACGNFGDHKFCRDGVWNCELMLEGDCAFTMHSLGQRWSCCCAVATRVRSAQISTARVSAGSRLKESGTMPTVNHDDGVIEDFRADPQYAIDLLNDMLGDGAVGEVLITLRQMTKAFGGVQAVAEKAELNPTQLYRALSAEGNPTLSSLLAVLKAIGLRLAVEQIKLGAIDVKAANSEVEVATL